MEITEQQYRRIFSRFDKLDVIFLAFLHFALIALIVEALRQCSHDPGGNIACMEVRRT